VAVAKKIIDEPDEDIVAVAKSDRARSRGPVSRIMLFMRQVVTELKKVITPTRKELFSYTAVVLVFVVIMMLLVSLLDVAFGFAVQNVFGNGAAN
jgi:preprotein translocase subunit SecE